MELATQDPGDVPAFSRRLARLVLVPAYAPPAERLDAALGPELARFLVTALTQGRVGSSSPYVRT